MAIPQTNEAPQSASLLPTLRPSPSLPQLIASWLKWALPLLLWPVLWLKQAAVIFPYLAHKIGNKLSRLSFSVILLITVWVMLGISHICFEACLLAPVLHKVLLLTSGGSHEGVVFGVLSGRDHFMQRLAVRNTWASEINHASSGYLPSKIVFVVGQEDCHIHPKLRIAFHTCQSAMNTGTFAAKWNSTSLQTSTDSAEKVDTLIRGLSFVALTDVFITSLLVNHHCSVSVQINDRNFFQFEEIIEHKNGPSFFEVKINHIVHAKEAVKILIVTANEQLSLASPVEQCKWSNGSSSVKYDFIKLQNGNTQPWTDGLCVPFTIIFENGKSQCPPNWILYDGHCYFFSSTQLSWYMAADACRELDAVLTSIADAEENAFLADKKKRNSYSAWIGLIANASSRTFNWIDGSDTSYKNWDDYEPNINLGSERCGCVKLFTNSGVWNDHHCSSHLNYICRKPRVSEADLKPEFSVETQQQLQQQWLERRETIREQVAVEQRLYGDLLVVPGHIDSHHTVPEKLFALLKWTSVTHPGHWLFKVDDDTLVNVRLVMRILDGLRSQLPSLHYCGMAVSQFDEMTLIPFVLGKEHPFRKDFSPPRPRKAGYLLSDEVVSGLVAVAPQLNTQYSETVSLAVWLSTLTFPCTPSPDPLWNTALNKMLRTSRSAISGITRILEELLLAKVPVSKAALMDSTVSLLAPPPSMAAPAQLISQPCWRREQHSRCHDNFVVATNLTMDELDQLYKAYFR